MSYATQQDLIDAFGAAEIIQLTDRSTPPTNAIDVDVLAKAQARADAEIDGYLSTRYTLPLASTPLVLVGFACDLARFYLHVNGVPELVAKRKDAVVKSLDSISAGRISLGLDQASQPAAAADTVHFDKGSKVFGRDRQDECP